MATSRIPRAIDRYKTLKKEVCIVDRNKQYDDLTDAIMSRDVNESKHMIKKIVNITKCFVNAFNKEEINKGNKKLNNKRYCGDEIRCQTLPYSKDWPEKQTRGFIPTAYHILQEYDLLHLKARVNFIDIKERNKKSISVWGTLTYSDINDISYDIENSNEKKQYYDDCISTINQIIYLRTYDIGACLKNRATTKQIEDHEGFIKELRTLRESISELKNLS